MPERWPAEAQAVRDQLRALDIPLELELHGAYETALVRVEGAVRACAEVQP